MFAKFLLLDLEPIWPEMSPAPLGEMTLKRSSQHVERTDRKQHRKQRRSHEIKKCESEKNARMRGSRDRKQGRKAESFSCAFPFLIALHLQVRAIIS